MQKKQKVWMWTESVKIEKMTDSDRKNYNAREENITPAENIANILQICPNDGIESLIKLIAMAAKFGIAIGEDDSNLESRIYASIMAVTTESKNR